MMPQNWKTQVNNKTNTQIQIYVPKIISLVCLIAFTSFASYETFYMDLSCSKRYVIMIVKMELHTQEQVQW